MKLRSVNVTNFRSIVNGKINLKDYTSLIGPNNSGKSSFVKSIELFLNQSMPLIEEFSEAEPEVIETHGIEIKKRIFNNIIIEGVFKDIEDWERRKSGVSGIIFNNEIKLRETISAQHDPSTNKISMSKMYEAYVRREVFTGLDESKLAECSEEIKVIVRREGFNGTNFKTKVNINIIKEKIKEELPDLFAYGDWEWSSENFGIDAALKQAIPNALVIPALTSIDDALKSTQSSIFGKLLSKLIMPKVKACQHYHDVTSSFSSLVEQLKSDESIEGLRELRNDITNRISEIIDAKLILGLQEPEYEKIMGGIVELRLDDGKETPVSLQGHGLQRSLIFTLLEVIAKHDAKSAEDDEECRSTVLLYEEPELFIHPHLMRKLKSVLSNVSSSSQWQVIITTHSPFLINVADDPCSLVVLKKENGVPPVVAQLDDDPFVGEEKTRLRAALDYHPSVCEAFFAKRSVLVEGATEVAMFSEAKKLVDIFSVVNSLHKETTVVSCGGKWTITAIAKVMNELSLPYKVIHDRDLKNLDSNNPQPESAIHPYNANKVISNAVGNAANIFVVADTMEDILWPEGRPNHSSDKPYKAWVELKKIIKSIEDENDPANKAILLAKYQKLGDIVRFAYN